MRGAGGGHRLPVIRVVVQLHVGVGRGGPRRRRQLVGARGSLRDGLPHDAAPDQEGPVQVLRRQVAVVRVAGGGGRPRGPAQAAGEAPQDVAELRRRPQGRSPRPPLRGQQEGGVQGAAVVVGGDKEGGDADAGAGARATSVICLGDFARRPAHQSVQITTCSRDAVFSYLARILGMKWPKGIWR